MGIINGLGIAIAIVIAFILGGMMVISSYHRSPDRMLRSYPKEGTLLITDIEGNLGADLNLNIDISDVMKKNVIILEVHTQKMSKRQFNDILNKEKEDESNVSL